MLVRGLSTVFRAFSNGYKIPLIYQDWSCSSMRTAKLVVLVALLMAGRAVGQVEEKEPAAILEIGGAGEWALTHGTPSYGPNVAVEFTPIKEWLEIEAGTTPFFSRGQTEWKAFMAQIFDRSSNALARASLVLTGLIVIALGVTLDQLQRSPWVTRQGQRPDQPVPFSHKHHVQGLGLQCQYCHTTVEKSSYAGIPPTKTCMNCHAQIWTNAQLLEPVRTAGRRAVAGVDQGARPAGFCLLQPRDSREQGHRLRELPRARGPDAADVRAEHAADGVVPGLPSQSGEESAADERDLQHGVGEAGGGQAGVVRGGR
jgi:hypothetical protein